MRASDSRNPAKPSILSDATERVAATRKSFDRFQRPSQWFNRSFQFGSSAAENWVSAFPLSSASIWRNSGSYDRSSPHGFSGAIGLSNSSAEIIQDVALRVFVQPRRMWRADRAVVQINLSAYYLKAVLLWASTHFCVLSLCFVLLSSGRIAPASGLRLRGLMRR